MMKKRLLFLASFACSIPAFAQMPAITGATGKTTHTEKRLIATSIYRLSGGDALITDSTNYTYSGTRGGVPPADIYDTRDNAWQLNYDLSVAWGTALSTSFSQEFRVANTYDADNRVLTSTYSDWSGLDWVYNNKITYTYDASGYQNTKMVQTWDPSGSVWRNASLAQHFYDKVLHTDTTVNQRWNFTSGAWDLSGRIIDSYNSSGNLERSVQQILSVSTPEDYQQTLYTYDGAGNLVNELVQESYAGAWRNDAQTIRNYNAAGILIESYGQRWDGTAWTNMGKSANTFDAKGFIDKTYLINYDALSVPDTAGRVEITRDATGLPVKAIGYDRTTGVFVPGSIRYYYYEAYTTAIPELITRGGRLAVFPVPAQDVLQVDLQWELSQGATAAVYDITGHTWKHWHVPDVTNYKDQLSIAELPSGMYFIAFYGIDNGRIVQPFTIVK